MGVSVTSSCLEIKKLMNIYSVNMQKCKKVKIRHTDELFQHFGFAL